VANQNSGTVSVIDLGSRSVADTLQVGANSRPEMVRLLPAGGMLAVTEPVAGVVDFFDLASKAKFQTRAVASDLAFQQANVYLANPIGATAMFAPVNVTASGVGLGSLSTINLDPGLRSVAIDPLDNVALVSSESSGTVTLIDLSTNRVTGTINAVRGESETVARNDRTDRDRAANTPVITSIIPSQAAAGSTVQLTVNASDVGGAFDVFFAGPGGAGRDAALNVTALDVDPSGGQVRITVQIAPGAAKGEHLLRAFTPNGESGAVAGTGNVLTVL
jgi:YVTN family beta-propeller protein